MVSAVDDAKSVCPDVFIKGVAQTGQVWHARGLDDTVSPQLLDGGGLRVGGVVLQLEEHLVVASCYIFFFQSVVGFTCS